MWNSADQSQRTAGRQVCSLAPRTRHCLSCLPEAMASLEVARQIAREVLAKTRASLPKMRAPGHTKSSDEFIWAYVIEELLAPLRAKVRAVPSRQLPGTNRLTEQMLAVKLAPNTANLNQLGLPAQILATAALPCYCLLEEAVMVHQDLQRAGGENLPASAKLHSLHYLLRHLLHQERRHAASWRELRPHLAEFTRFEFCAHPVYELSRQRMATAWAALGRAACPVDALIYPVLLEVFALFLHRTCVAYREAQEWRRTAEAAEALLLLSRKAPEAC